MSMNLFAQLTKVDEAKRLVFARAAQEVVDKSDEIMDYISSKPHFQKWSSEISADTDGKNLGNVRAMHGKIAAGRLTQIDFNDSEKAVDVCAYISDDQEFRKCLDGTYTGLSIGGSYVGEKIVEKIDGKDIKRYTARPAEISLVDRPCIPTAKFFSVEKADGTLAKVDFKDPDPLDTSSVAAAIEKLDEIDGGTVEGTPDQVDELTKIMGEKGLSLEDIITFAKGDTAPDGCSQQKWDAMSAQEKKDWKADAAGKDKGGDADSDEDDAAKAEFYDAAIALAKIDGKKIVKVGDEEHFEFEVDHEEYLGKAEIAAGEAALAKLEAALADPLVKIGARNNATDKGRLNAIHSAAVDLGADCSAAKIEPAPELQKVEAETLAKLVADAIEPLQKALDDAQLKIKKLEEQPAAPRVSLRAVTKAQDTIEDDGAPTEAALVKDDHGVVHPAASLIKQAISEGGKPLLYRG